MNKKALEAGSTEDEEGEGAHSPKKRIRTLPQWMDWIVFARCGKRRSVRQPTAKDKADKHKKQKRKPPNAGNSSPSSDANPELAADPNDKDEPTEYEHSANSKSSCVTNPDNSARTSKQASSDSGPLDDKQPFDLDDACPRGSARMKI
eukprot:CAMPEP_0206518120 /NCGR_PEP_ID=MMETSP0324_2-20121206/64399_1 /ASSEMBLY_ACC=CAM_ASM_000836 /TAXON_ID=2866 /ORGANISM="Crypthecodinium cohnii, Strain Seligo" /LENGTH=147 /DNA_ID=CAMNT_0054011435 /DNA_START=36 /DNA_END=479 /DNA_ORIENTATION=+